MYNPPNGYLNSFTGIDFQIIPKPKDNELIVMTFDTEKWGVYEATQICQQAQEFFGVENIIAVFDGVKFECQDIDYVIEKLENMKK